jgi:hypothetical protein
VYGCFGPKFPPSSFTLSVLGLLRPQFYQDATTVGEKVRFFLQAFEARRKCKKETEEKKEENKGRKGTTSVCGALVKTERQVEREL